MGRIAPRRSKTTQVNSPLRNLWTTLMSKRPTRAEHEHTPDDQERQPTTRARPASSRSYRTWLRSPWLKAAWAFPARLHWMDPLPLPHRRGILLAALVVLLAILWPSASTRYPVEQPVSQDSREIPLQANLQESTARPATAESGSGWQTYRIQPGQTLAQLFRDNNLMVNDVFAMAQVEGDDKPLSNLQAGQPVKIQRNAQGVVTALEIDTSTNPVRFIRQPDGSYRRVG
ncbi:MAG: LysM-like peptidoglycan-binding domain-containing protein [Yersiniaceae bacterium]|nr:LysM-like peptidoglycan-binding domain-containing protein [Yersiniaceae bacterium]